MSLNCQNITKITDITDQIDYEDKKSGGLGDSTWVSCGQVNGYNELKNKYTKYFKGFTEESIAKIMCKCCKSLKPTGREKVSWKDFYKCMKSKSSHEGFIQVLDDLIARN